MKKIWLFLFSFFIGIVLLIWVIKFVGWLEIKKAILVFTGWQGLVIFFLTLFLALIMTWKWKEILKGEGNDVSFSNLFKFYLAGLSLTYLFPMIFWGGETFRAYLLKRKSSISWSKGMASVIIDRIFDWTTNLIVVFFGVIFFLLTIGLPPKKLAIIFGGTFLFWIIGISFFYFKTFKRESIARFFINFFTQKSKIEEPLEVEKEIFNFFKIKKTSFLKGLGLAFLEEVINFFRIGTLISFLGKNIGPLPVLSIDGFSYLAGMIPIPTAIGSHEALQLFAFTSLGLGAGTGIAYTMIFRGAELILAFLGILIFFRLGFKLLEGSQK